MNRIFVGSCAAYLTARIARKRETLCHASSEALKPVAAVKKYSIEPKAFEEHGTVYLEQLFT
jgi:hypothetical protein